MTHTSTRRKVWINAALVVIMLASLWAGWHDGDLWMTQEAVRDSIRGVIRRTVQLLVQYLVPAAILAHFIRSAFLQMKRDAGGR